MGARVVRQSADAVLVVGFITATGLAVASDVSLYCLFGLVPLWLRGLWAGVEVIREYRS